jgi:HEAT repeat protein
MDLSSLTLSNWQERRQAIESLVEVKGERLSEALLDLVRSHPQDLTSLNAALQLLHFLDAPVVPGLINLLHEDDPEIQAYAAIVLGQVKDKKQRHSIIAALLKTLEEASQKKNAVNLQFNIIEALGRLKARQAVDQLLQILSEKNFFLSYGVIHALGEIGDSQAQPYLLEMINDEMLDNAAISALGNFADLSAVEPIAAWLDTPKGDPEVASMALGRIIQIRIPPGTIKSSDSQLVIQTGQRLLRNLKEEALEKLLGAAPEAAQPHLPSGKAAHLPELAQVLGILAYTINASKNNEAELQFDTSRLFSALVRLLKHPDAHRAASAALAGLGKPAIPWLVDILHPAEIEDDTDCMYRREAAHALGDIGDPEAISPLEAALKGDDTDVGMAAAESLGKIGGEEAVRVLFSQLNHHSAGVRKAVVQMLGSLQKPLPVKDYIELLKSQDPFLKEAGIRLLAAHPEVRKNDKACVALILGALADPQPLVRRAAVEALPFFEDPQIPSALTDALQNGEPEMRSTAARALSSCSPKFALPLLYEALSDPNPWVKMYACRSIAYFGIAQSFENILPLLKDPMPPIRAAAAEALGKIGAKTAIGPLQTLLADEEPEVQRAVELALTTLMSEK